jgi:hypothetical protein
MSDSLKNFLTDFVAEHALISGGELVLDVSKEELEYLGDFFLRGICGWALGLKAERTRPRLIEVTPTSSRADDEITLEETDETNEGKSSIN